MGKPGLSLKLALLAALALCGWGASAAFAIPSFPTTVCGHFVRSQQDFVVYGGGGISCQTATKLIKDFAHGKAKQHGTSDAGSYWTIKGDPGFRCIQSMEQGECYKGSEIAGYKIKQQTPSTYPVRRP